MFVCGEHHSVIGAAVSRSCVMDVTGMMLGVLFRVMQWLRCFVLFKARLVVGLQVLMMVGKSVMHGIVIVAVSLITHCSSSCTCSCNAFATLCFSSTTLCSSRMGVGFNKCSILCYQLPPFGGLIG